MNLWSLAALGWTARSCLDAQLYYANALTVRDEIMGLVADPDTPVRAILIDAAAQAGLDITGSDMLKGLVSRLRKRGIDVDFADVRQPVLGFAARTNLLELIGEDHLFPTIQAAVDRIEAPSRTGQATTTRSSTERPAPTQEGSHR